MATLSDTEVKAALADVPGWELAGADIVKEYKFKDFVGAMAFVNRVADRAEAANHHPDILVHGWSRVRLTLTNHSEGGLTEADFELAKTLDGLE